MNRFSRIAPFIGLLLAGCATEQHSLTSSYNHPGPITGETLGTGEESYVAEDVAYYIGKSHQLYNSLESFSVNLRFDVFAESFDSKPKLSFGGSIIKKGNNYRTNSPEEEAIQNDEGTIVCDKKTRKMVVTKKEPQELKPLSYPVELDNIVRFAKKTEVIMREESQQVEIRFLDVLGIPLIYVLLSSNDFACQKMVLFYLGHRSYFSNRWKMTRVELTYSAIEKNHKFPDGSFSDSSFYRMISGKPKGVGSYRRYKVEISK